MEPRQLWNRNTVLAEAFCLSDEHVRSAQSALDETQAQRSRLLAAFAVTIGSDSAVSDLLGLSEREVRVARRTVGKEDARRMAEDVLATTAAAEAAENLASQAAPDGGHGAPHSAAHTGHAAHATHAAPQVQQQTAPAPPPPAHTPQHPAQSQHQAAYQQQQQYAPQATSHLDVQAPAPTSYESPMTSTAEIPVVRETAWTSAMDLVLIDSWQSGIDLRVLADEFGLDLARLVTRVQQLSAEGRLTTTQPSVGTEDRSGRHRRDASGSSGGSYSNVSSGGGSYTNGSYTGSYGNGSYTNGSYTNGSYSTGSTGGSYTNGSYTNGSYSTGSTGGYSTGSYDSYGNGVTTSGWEAPSTIPEDMVANYLPPQHNWPNYMAGSSMR
ncbi:hypothetical protein [Streptomyces sp. NPDC047108]|uniref:hypothetical protein n=1 Tax=Streptomyces sp. NPDC047108 TaxID=3155025 RepID=UPI0033D5A913